MNDLERTELEAENDGYRNEFQRAFAHSRLTTPLKNERNKANELVASGKTVVLYCHPVYCRATDAVIGEDVSIASVGDDYESAVGPLLNTMEAEMGDGRYEVLPIQVPPVEAPMEEIDEIPF